MYVGVVLIAAGVFTYAVWRFDLMHRPRVSKKEHQHELGQPGQQATAPHDGDADDTRGPTFPH